MEYIINGDTILVSRKFKFTVGGLVQFFIRYFQNFVYVVTFQWRKVSIYHHVASVVKNNGTLCVYEAIDEGYVNSGSVELYLNDPSMHRYIIRRAKMPIDFEAYEKAQNDMLGLKYWFWGTLFFQLIKQFTWDLVWLGGNSETHVYCSHAGAKGLCNATNGILFKRYFATDPQDIYVSKGLFTVPNEKKGIFRNN